MKKKNEKLPGAIVVLKSYRSRKYMSFWFPSKQKAKEFLYDAICHGASGDIYQKC